MSNRRTLRLSLLPVALACLTATAAHATPTNLVVNGSFEGQDGLAGWSIGGTAGDGALPVAIEYNQSSYYPTGAQGESVPTDNASSKSTDAAGSNGVYFVSDKADGLSVYQYVYLTPGSYDIGFDSYATFNGFVQPKDALFTADIAGVQLASYLVSSVEPGLWATHAGEALITAAGDYLVSFAFYTSDGNSKDVVIDRAYVLADRNGGGTPIATVPEPASLALLAGGLGLVGVSRRPRRRASSGTEQS